MGNILIANKNSIVLGDEICKGTEETSALSIIESLDIARLHSLDSIAIIRGGGSAQELSVFNNEKLCRHIFEYPTPIISGIGHQTDSNLVEAIVDHAAVTPTACAVFLTEPFSQLLCVVVGPHQ